MMIMIYNDDGFQISADYYIMWHHNFNNNKRTNAFLSERGNSFLHAVLLLVCLCYINDSAQQRIIIIINIIIRYNNNNNNNNNNNTPL